MRRILVVASQTLGSAELAAEIERQLADAECEFHVVVPLTPIGDYHGSPAQSRMMPTSAAPTIKRVIA